MRPEHIQHLGGYERRNWVINTGHYDIPEALAFGAGIATKTQSILSRETGEIISKEYLIHAPEKEIEKILSDSELGFQIFLSQLIRAFQSGEHSHINVDLSSLRRPDFVDRLAQVLQNFRRKRERSKVVIEVTERGAHTDVFSANTARSMKFLKDAGFSIYVDDFDPFHRIPGSVSALTLTKYNTLISGLKIPYQYKGELLVPSLDGYRLMSTIPPSIQVVAEGYDLSKLREKLPHRIDTVQDPLA